MDGFPHFWSYKTLPHCSSFVSVHIWLHTYYYLGYMCNCTMEIKKSNYHPDVPPHEHEHFIMYKVLNLKFLVPRWCTWILYASIDETAWLLAAKRSVGVAPEANLRNLLCADYETCKPGNPEIKKTGISDTTENDLCPRKIKNKIIFLWFSLTRKKLMSNVVL